MKDNDPHRPAREETDSPGPTGSEAVSRWAVGTGVVPERDRHLQEKYLEQYVCRDGQSSELPWSVPPDECSIWERSRDDPATQRLAEEYLEMQLADARGFTQGLVDLAGDATFRQAAEDPRYRPQQVVGHVRNPDGGPAQRVQVTLGRAMSGAVPPVAYTSDDGSFVLRIPQAWRASTDLPHLPLLITGAKGDQTLHVDWKAVLASGLLPPLTLSKVVEPLPLGLFGQLQQLVADEGTAPAGTAADATMPVVQLGEDACELVFRTDSSQDRFPFPVFFRLTDPALSKPTLMYALGDNELYGGQALAPVYSTVNPLDALAGTAKELHIRRRTPLDRPISVEAFRDNLAQNSPWWDQMPLASSLSIGYVVQMAQRWTPRGLALGDLVYSLPLAPGEQQRIAVVERTANSSVIESETLDSTEQMSYSQQDDTSAAATFTSAYQEAAQGGSAYSTEASSFSIAAAAGGGAFFPFGAAGGGVSTSYGTASNSGQTNTWLSGSRDSTSVAAQQTHAATHRQAAARRRTARSGMRMATASERGQVVTKVIANHNKTRALTVQYWEVLRMFDVQTAVEGVTLVCLVPLDVVRFLPYGQPRELEAAPTDRAEVLARYGRLLKHSEVLGTVLPVRNRRGLALLTEFAADPNATVQSSSDPAQDILQLSVTGTFLPLDEVFVTVVSKQGLRAGPVPLNAAGATVPPIRGDVDGDRTQAFSTEQELFGHLRARRTGSSGLMLGDVVLPSSIPRQDVVGFEITRRFRPLDYHFLPPAVRDLSVAQELFGAGTALPDFITVTAQQPSRSVSFTPERLEQELGGPRLSAFSAQIPATPGTGSAPGTPEPSVVFASASWGTNVELSRTKLPVSSRLISPLLGYGAILEIEKTLQWTVRHTMACTVAVYASLTPEERAVMLERYEIPVPPDEDGNPQDAVPLLSCVTNNVLGYYGNSMVLPFQIPVAVTRATTVVEHGEVVTKGLTTGDVQSALTRFHTDGFDPPRSTIALPTKGVLGEAVLGHCPSAEKIDLTRFWHWQDSPGDEATAIGNVTMPSGAMAVAPEAAAGTALTGTTAAAGPVINNIATPMPDSDKIPAGLATALITAAAGQKLDTSVLTNAANLEKLTEKTQDTAEGARKDALASATSLAGKAIDGMVALKKAKDQADAQKKAPADPAKTTTPLAKKSGGGGAPPHP
ncbi:hypothetical protein [Actinacidiphila paucisporea]|uniref:Uncharacterized protein n=1 Tax=Actinacidiphila paucisporea TaxID=310782 RepID=A0A1M7MMH8_9ACTN|nr:hypothetical protein [Actinacidiphila paucisporea]SHM92187.1 hypothetical protein SAMN05216499_116106 [Actinacidiphila paucisporea]